MTEGLHPDYIAFLRAWLDFAEDPENNPYGFYRGDGLCYAAYSMALYPGNHSKTHLQGVDTSVCRILRGRINNEKYPFNKGPQGYERETDKTKNPARLAFVRKELSLAD